MADFGKINYIPADNYSISLVLRNKESIQFPDYDNRFRTFSESRRELDDIIKGLSTNPFGKVTLTIKIGYDSESFMDRDILVMFVDEIIRRHRTSNIKIVKGVANISFKA